MKCFVLALLLLLIGCSAPPQHKRSHTAIAHFKKQHPCPATGADRGACPGYVIDHIKALECGGADDPSNMQWQTIEEGKAKDKWERKQPGCPGY